MLWLWLLARAATAGVAVGLLTLTSTCIIDIQVAHAQTETTVPAAYYWGGVTADTSGSYLCAAQQRVASQTTYDGKIYCSSDGGNVWKVSASAPAVGYFSLAASSNGQHLVASAQGTIPIWISSDYGSSWTAANGGPSPGYAAASAVSSDGAKMAYASGYSGCFSYSSNYGMDWTTDLGPSTASSGGCSSMTMDNAGSTVVLSVDGYGLYTSTDAGTSWELTYSTSVEISSTANGGGVFYAGMYDDPNYLLTSTDGGSTWTTSAGTSSALYSLAVDSTGTKVFATSESGIYYSTDSGKAFTNIMYNAYGMDVSIMNAGGNASLWTAQQEFGVQLQPLYFGNPSKFTYSFSFVIPRYKAFKCDFRCDGPDLML
jgi:hypothetical protein